LLIVLEIKVFPADTLCCVSFLFHLEDVLHEELLQTLICVVDTELFKTKI
jgi:hypothetical protein